MALYLDDKPMTKKAALEFLGISPTFIPQTRRKIIECNTRQVDRDKFRPAKSIGGKPEYLVFVPHLEKEVRIRYANQQRPGKESGSFIYPHPKTLALKPAEDGTCLIPDELEFLFWFLRPMCLQSPFRNKDSQSFYQFQDNDARATADMALEESRILAMSIIVGPESWTDTQLRQLAKGMNVGGVNDMTPIVVKSELKKLAYKDPAIFYNKANSREVLFNGKIQEAIDGNVLTLKSMNGMQRWYLNNKEILPITFGQDALNELKNHMAEKWYLYETEIRDALAGMDISSKLNNPVNDAAFAKEPVTVTGRIKSELSPEEIDLLSKYEKEDWFQNKMQKIDAYDKSDPDKMHPAQLKSWRDNEAVYEAWKKQRDLESA